MMVARTHVSPDVTGDQAGGGGGARNPPLDLSVVLPVHNEERNVGGLAAEMAAVFDEAGLQWEAVWVDDGSDDGTWAALLAARRNDPRHRVIGLRRRHGQSAALLAGLAESCAPVIAMMDGDGQDDPHGIVPMFRIVAGRQADLVAAVRRHRRDPVLRRVSGRVAVFARRALLGDRLTDGGTPRVCRRDIMAHVCRFKAVHRFLPVLVQLAGFRAVEVPVVHRPRVQGKSKYGIWNRLWIGIVDLAGVAWIRRRRIVVAPGDIVRVGDDSVDREPSAQRQTSGAREFHQ